MLRRKEFTGILITTVVTKMLLVYPRYLVLNSGQAAWMQVIYVTLIAGLLLFITSKVYKYKKNIIELAEMTGKKGLKIITGLVVFSILMMNFATVARIFPETIKNILLHETSIEIIKIVFAISVGTGAYFGIKSVSRINILFLPIAGAVFVGFLMLLIPYYKFENLMPVFGNGFKSLFLYGFNAISLYSDIIVINILMPYSKSLSEVKICTRNGFFISAAVSFLIILAYCLAYVYPVSKDYIIPVYQLTRIIHISSFFSRFEAFFQFIWSILIFIYSSIYIYAMTYVLQTTFNLKYSKPLIFPVVVIGIIISGIPSVITDSIKLDEIVSVIEYPIVFLLPLIFAVSAKKKKEKD